MARGRLTGLRANPLDALEIVADDQTATGGQHILPTLRHRPFGGGLPVLRPKALTAETVSQRLSQASDPAPDAQGYRRAERQ